MDLIRNYDWNLTWNDHTLFLVRRSLFCSVLYEEHDLETNRNLLQLLDPTRNSRVYRSRRKLARDEQTYYERFYRAATNDRAVKNAVASIASLAALLLAKVRPNSHGARSLPRGP